jgi:hypothetical protein
MAIAAVGGSVGSITYAIAMLAHDSAQLSAKESGQTADAEHDEAIAADEESISKLRDKAQSELIGGLVTASISEASAGLQFYQAGAECDAAAAKAKLEAESDAVTRSGTAPTDGARARIAGLQSEVRTDNLFAARSAAVAKGLDGLATASKASFGAVADQKDADSREASRRADEAKKRMDESNQFKQSASSAADKSTDECRTLLRDLSETQRLIAQKI